MSQSYGVTSHSSGLGKDVIELWSNQSWQRLEEVCCKQILEVCTGALQNMTLSTVYLFIGSAGYLSKQVQMLLSASSQRQVLEHPSVHVSPCRQATPLYTQNAATTTIQPMYIRNAATTTILPMYTHNAATTIIQPRHCITSVHPQYSQSAKTTLLPNDKDISRVWLGIQ